MAEWFGMNFKSFRWSRKGYAAVLNGNGSQALVSQVAFDVMSKANASMPPDDYDLPAHEVKTFKGKLATGRVVRTKTDAARLESARTNNLKKALDSTGGI